MRSLERVNERTNVRTYVRTYSHTYVRDRPYIPSTTLLCEGIKIVIYTYKQIYRSSINTVIIIITYICDTVLSHSCIISWLKWTQPFGSRLFAKVYLMGCQAWVTMFIEDLTRVVFSYEIYETSLERVS